MGGTLFSAGWSLLVSVVSLFSSGLAGAAADAEAAAAGAEVYLTGEIRHHDALAATAAGLTIICVGHSNSERIALSAVADRLTEALPSLAVSQSASDADPLLVL